MVVSNKMFTFKEQLKTVRFMKKLPYGISDFPRIISEG